MILLMSILQSWDSNDADFLLVQQSTHAGEKGGQYKNGQNQLELSKWHCNGSLCSQK